ncbi:hypothetical protein CDAR_228741 [Caerostris darwini]|uniref:Uncharacterized protein n=1 Tax=Caerostris darwini TaxID=1538125 RepID=A0AAV4PGY4_9ARAC|nr:hypothetical protein CDAR_228741 [Caerostris darwini]
MIALWTLPIYNEICMQPLDEKKATDSTSRDRSSGSRGNVLISMMKNLVQMFFFKIIERYTNISTKLLEKHIFVARVAISIVSYKNEEALARLNNSTRCFSPANMFSTSLFKSSRSFLPPTGIRQQSVKPTGGFLLSPNHTQWQLYKRNSLRERKPASKELDSLVVRRSGNTSSLSERDFF